MANVTIRPVDDRRSLETFIQFHYDLYRGDPYDAPNLHSDEVQTLSPYIKDPNAAFEFCDAQYFLAYRDGKVVGRVAAIINHRYNEQWQRPAVRFGWIDFVDDLEVSRALLKAVEQWGRERGMKEIIGPLGFTDMDPEGMLTHGFDQLGTMATLYNYPYYPRHMEQMEGYEKDNDYVEYKLFVPKEGMPEKFMKVSEMIMKRYNLQVKKLTKEDVFGPEQYGQRVFDVINKTFGHLYGYSTMSQKQIDQYIKMYFKVLDLDLVTLIEDHSLEEHPVVGCGITIPSLTRALQKCRNGRLWPFGWWHLLRALKMHKTNIVDCLLIGVLPEYRAKGANALLFYDLIPRYQKLGFEWGETHVEMETNGKVQSQWTYLDHEQHKRRRCYKKAL
ncbi:MAG: N-acetyltransferase [Prevotella sp.]|nr:N-acetyltransferase [Prevotella sp.]